MPSYVFFQLNRRSAKRTRVASLIPAFRQIPRNRHAVHALLQDKRIPRIRELARLHRLPLLPARRS